jgi:DUF1680 family protein
VPIQQVTIDDAFWTPKRQVWRTVTIPDVFTKFEKDGAIRNYDRVHDGAKGGHEGPPFLDGLLCESIRGAADFLAEKRDPALEQRLDSYAEHIAAAQSHDESGFINTATQLQEPAHRWGLNGGNDVIQHDLYNAGCVIEAGIHYYKATGKTRLLEVAVRLANNMCDVMGPPEKKSMVPGHGLPEEALTKLYLLFCEHPDLKQNMPVKVDEKRYLNLATYWIENRGDHTHRKPFEQFPPSYDQDHMPVLEQATLEGHAVRGTLMCAGLSALAVVNQKDSYRDASLRLWKNLTQKRIYITGGVGAVAEIEGFAPDYILPNNGYLESCAAIGSGFFSQNMNQLCADARFVDELERVLYNGALCAVSLKGDSYYYQNPLDVRKPLERWSWHGCPCCPPMFLKFMGAMPGWIYAQDDLGVYVNLFVGSEAKVPTSKGLVTLRQATQYPWEGKIRITVTPEQISEFDLNVRIPAWAEGVHSEEALYFDSSSKAANKVTIKVNGKAVKQLPIHRGYAQIHRTWKAGDIVELNLPMNIRRIHANGKVEADKDRGAIMRGPVVYCAENMDNPGGIRHLVAGKNARWNLRENNTQLASSPQIEGKVKGLYRNAQNQIESRSEKLILIPYFANSNRRPSEMLVWLAEKPEAATPQSIPTIASKAIPSASHCCPSDSLQAMSDGILPSSSDDTHIPRFTWWDHRGTKEWVQYSFAKPTALTEVSVYWWDERRIQAHCRVPKAWQVFYLDKGHWQKVTETDSYGVLMDQMNTTHFNKITTTALRIEVDLQPEWSGGILEWSVR